MMRALLWKDFRNTTEVLGACLALIVASYVFALILVPAENGSIVWSKVLGGGASLIRLTSVLMCALMGAYTFGREFENGSHAFVAALPVPKRRAVLSKLFVALSVVATMWLASLIALWIGVRAMGYDNETFRRMLWALSGFAACGVLTFSAALLLSFWTRSSMSSAFLAMALLVSVCFAQLLVNRSVESPPPGFFHVTTTIAMIVLSATAVAAGILLYVTHTDPRISRDRNTARAREAVRIHSPYAGPLHALLWKDLRLARVSLGIGVAVILLPYVLTVMPVGGDSTLVTLLQIASIISILLSAIAFPFWSSAAVAGERVTGTVAFLDSLPARTGTVLLSKAGVSLLPVLVLVGFNLAIMLAARAAIGMPVDYAGVLTWQISLELGFELSALALSAGVIVGTAVAWYLAARSGRTVMATALGVLTTPIIVAAWGSLSSKYGADTNVLSPVLFLALFGAGVCVLSAILIAAGARAAARIH
jgi:ABC-type transport system involved in multi-copper enzyme maturation permease subunit